MQEKSRFTDSQSIAILKQAETSVQMRTDSISSTSFYKKYSKYAGMNASLMVKVWVLEAKNPRLKKMYAEEQLNAKIIPEAMAKK